MKAKEFFKSNSFKCIIVLLVITLVCGSIIAMCAVLFKVPDEERLTRSLTAIYGSADLIPEYEDKGVKDKAGQEIVDDKGNVATSRAVTFFYDKQGFYPDDETELAKDSKDKTRKSSYTVVIQQVIVDENGSCLVKAKGKGCGFSGGSVTVWVMFDLNGPAIDSIQKVVCVGNETDSSQTLIGQFKADYFAQYATDGATEVVRGGGYFTTGKMSVVSDDNIEVVSAGATYTSTAMDVAVNGALYYVREQLPLGALIFTGAGNSEQEGQTNG